jgi:hypothetical protein
MRNFLLCLRSKKLPKTIINVIVLQVFIHHYLRARHIQIMYIYTLLKDMNFFSPFNCSRQTYLLDLLHSIQSHLPRKQNSKNDSVDGLHGKTLWDYSKTFHISLLVHVELP